MHVLRLCWHNKDFCNLHTHKKRPFERKEQHSNSAAPKTSNKIRKYSFLSSHFQPPNLSSTSCPGGDWFFSLQVQFLFCSVDWLGNGLIDSFGSTVFHLPEWRENKANKIISNVLPVLAVQEKKYLAEETVTLNCDFDTSQVNVPSLATGNPSIQFWHESQKYQLHPTRWHDNASFLPENSYLSWY